MYDQERWINSMLDLAQLSFENGVRNMEIFQKQAEKAVDLTMNNIASLQTETQTGADSWMNDIKEVQKIYLNTINDGFANFGNQVAKVKPKAK